MIDIRYAGEKYTLFHYQQDFHRVFRNIAGRKKIPILCGGSGLYIESVLKGYRLIDVPENPTLRESLSGKTLEELTEILASYKKLHNTTDTDTKKRAIRAIEIADYQAKQQAEELTFDPIDSLIIGIDIDRELRRQNISSRLKKRLDEGLIDEVKQLLQSGVTVEDLLYYGLEYKFVTLYVVGSLSYDEMFAQLETAIHQFAKRQMTWFRGMERRGFAIHWIDATLPLDDKVGKCLELWSVYTKGKKNG